MNIVHCVRKVLLVDILVLNINAPDPSSLLYSSSTVIVLKGTSQFLISD